MRIPVVMLLALTILHTVSTSTTTAASARSGQEERAAVGAILALDAAVQKRFEKVDGRFGLARLPLRGGAHGFVPQNDAELSSLRELEEANVHVVLYLGGRGMLGPAPDERREHWSDRIKGPAFITRERSPAAPSAESLSEEGRRALTAFERNESQYAFDVQRWSVLARPVRAVNGTCLKCHRSSGENTPWGPTSDLGVGDVLGVIFYVYQELGSARTTASR
jgi:hypothetical protein